MIRLASAVVLIAIVLTSLWALPPWTTAVLAAVVAAAAGGEVARLAGRLGAGVSPGVVSVSAAAVVVAFVSPWPPAAGSGRDALVAVLIGLLILSGALTVAIGPPTSATLRRAAVMTMAPIYVGLPLGALAWIHATLGPAVTTSLLGTIVISDSAQYYTGRAIGTRKLAPSISPGKTVEGALGGLVATAIAGWVIGPRVLPGIVAPVGALVAVGLAAFGLLGNLFESALKRSANVKDSAGTIPGHGGVLDRIDAYLFAVPVFYLWARYVA